MLVTLWRLPSIFVGSLSLGLRTRTRRNSILESCKGHSTLPPKPFSHLKTQRDTHYMNTHNLCGSAFGNGETIMNVLFQNLQLFAGLLSSTGDLVQSTRNLLVTKQCSLLMQYVNNISFPSFKNFSTF